MTLSTTAQDQQTGKDQPAGKDLNSQAHYEAALAQNGRTFHWARRFLGAKHGPYAARLYAFCRLLDDLADGDLPDGAARLKIISDDLSRLSQDPAASANDPDMAAFAPFMQDRQLPAHALRHLIDGLEFDQGTVALQTVDELVIYGYQVAGTVGLMMCPILSCHDKRAQDFAIDLGIAMQLTNIARDVSEDAQMGRRYLPADWTDNLSASDIAQGAASGDIIVIATIQSAIAKTLALAERYYDSGLSGLAFLPKRAQIAIAIAAVSYRQIGRQLSANNLNWHQGRTVTSTATKAALSLSCLPYLLPQSRPHTHDKALHTSLNGYAK